MHGDPVKFIFCNDLNNWFFPFDEQWSESMRSAKLIIFFRSIVHEPYDIESVINSDIAPYIESQSIPICYAHQLDETPLDSGSRLFLMFGGRNVETSTFLVESIDEEKLR
ncbi:unnamed protein product, partial [Onchocerca flexuosa]|uniref:TIR domain-containing protein n=1 Tax=Onchocerca flexuosa TaxID=387005 RepID=A0A183I7R8_9BILA